MKTNIINPQIKNNRRLVRLSAIPELLELKEFIDYLDQKYQVNSSDRYNTFGHVELDRYLISYFYMGLLLLELRIPSEPDWTHYFPKQNLNQIPLTTEAPGVETDPEAIYLEQEDIAKLKTLREKAGVALDAYQSFFVNLPKDQVEKEYLDYYKLGILSEPFYRVDKEKLKPVYEKLLKEQGFALEGDFQVSKSDFWVDIAPEFLPFSREKQVLFRVNYYHYKKWEQPYLSMVNYNDLSENHPVFDFVKKWSPFYRQTLTKDELQEVMDDIELLRRYDLKPKNSPL